MKTTAIIAELNPFHNGHSSLFRYAKAKTGADFCIALMSGDFVQRGSAAIMEKYTRTRMALASGADLVLELPVYYSLGSAEYFASGAISTLNKLHVVDTLLFGSESGEMDGLLRIADLLATEVPSYQMYLQSALKKGEPFPVARRMALENCLPTAHKEDILLLDTPNNSLGIEYLKMMKRTHASYEARTMKRIPGVCAEQIRTSLLQSHGRIRRSYMPEQCALLLKEYPLRSGFSFAENNAFSPMLEYHLTMSTPASIAKIQDVGEELAARIYKLLPTFTTFDEFALKLKTKNLTYTRVNRALLHILLQQKKSHMEEYIASGTTYARVLGFRESASALLSRMKKESELPLITKLSQAASLLKKQSQGGSSEERNSGDGTSVSETSLTGNSMTGRALAYRLLEEDVRASAIYDICFSSHTEPRMAVNKFQKEIVVVP